MQRPPPPPPPPPKKTHETYNYTVRGKQRSLMLKQTAELVSTGLKGKVGKVHPCTGTEALYRPYGP